MTTAEPLFFAVCSSREDTRLEITRALEQTGEIRVIAGVSELDELETVLRKCRLRGTRPERHNSHYQRIRHRRR